jgi:hypothetical protein
MKFQHFNNCCWKNWVSTCRRLKLDACLLSPSNIHSKQIKDLNIRPATLKLLQERIKNTPENRGIAKNFLNRNPIAQQLRERTDK